MLKPKQTLLIATMFTTFVSFGQTSPKENILFNAFKQGQVEGGGNCASIALIKACIGTYGVGKVVQLVEDPNHQQINVKLRNNFHLVMTHFEIEAATLGNGFVLKEFTSEGTKIKKYADTLFAIMVKMNQKINEYDSYAESLTSLLNGYNTPIINELLGVKFRKIVMSALKNNSNIVTYNSYHAVYSSFGYYDEPKSIIGFLKIESFNRNHFGIKCLHYLCDPKKAFIID